MIANPFSSYPNIISYLNWGRVNLLKELTQIISLPRPEHRDFHGLPGMGKTSLLRYVAEPRFIEEFGAHLLGAFKDKPNHLFIVYLSGWIESIHPLVIFYHEFYRHYDLYRKQLESDQKPLPPELAKPESPLTDGDGDSALAHLELHIRQLADAGYRPVLLFDDFDKEHAFGQFTPPQAGRLSTWMPYCSFVFATERLLEEVNPSARKGSPLFKRLPQTIMREFTEEEAERVITKALTHNSPSEEFKVEFTQKDYTFLYQQSGGFPLHLLLASRELWDLRLRMGLTTAKNRTSELPDHTRQIVSSRLELEFAALFDSYYQFLSQDKRDILFRLAQQQEASQERRKKEGRGRQGQDIVVEMGSYNNQLSALEQYGLVRINQTGGIDIYSPLFRRFLLNQVAQASAPSEVESNLTEQQLTLYETFRRNADTVLTFADLGRQVWRWPKDRTLEEISGDEKRKIHIAVSKLRRHLDEAATGEHIVSLRTKGYRFETSR